MCRYPARELLSESKKRMSGEWLGEKVVEGEEGEERGVGAHEGETL